jgi:hypothetical protein
MESSVIEAGMTREDPPSIVVACEEGRADAVNRVEDPMAVAKGVAFVEVIADRVPLAR